VKGCSGVFQAFLMVFEEGLDLLVSMKGACFRVIITIVRLQICDSVWSGLPTLILNVVDGGFLLG
jgi:hypothetical protein